MLVQSIDTNVYKNNLVGFTGNKNAKKGHANSPLSAEKLSEDIRSGLDALGGKKLEIILHNASAPSKNGKDVGVGSLYSNSSKELLIPMLKTYGFSGIQADPEGMRPLHDASPYVTNSFVYNPLITDLEELTKPENGSLLDKNVYQTMVRINHASKSKGDYAVARDNFALAYENMWENFKTKAADADPSVAHIAQDFDAYKAQNGEMLEPYAIYSILTEKYNNDYYKNWPQDVQNLYNPRNDELISQLKEEYQDDIDKFIFTDMLAKQARDKGIEAYSNADIKTEGDNPVAFSNQEVWAHPGAFLKDYKMGCPPDGSNPDGQAWGFAVLNPAKLFNKDGSLGESGQLLYDKCLKLAKDNQGGIRIDHIVGLIDPFVYKNSPAERTAGRLFSSEHNPDLKQFAIPRGKADTAEKFGAMLEKIVLPACEEAGLTKDDILCEDLGAMPDHARAAFERLGLGGMVVTIWRNGLSAKPEDTVMLGSHDNEPFALYVDNLYGKNGQDPFNHALWSAVDNATPYASHDEKQAIFDKYRFDTNRGTPEQNKKGFIEWKLTELLTSPAKRVQIFWPDLLSMKDRYNTPGTSSGNWTLRMSADSLNSYDPVPMIKALSNALNAQDEDFVEENQELIDSLNNDIKELSKPGAKLNLNA